MYDRQSAVTYAHRWALRRNPQYYDYSNIGGDCTNFASQCLFAGLGAMDYSGDGWFYTDANRKSPSWTGVEFLYAYFLRTGRGAAGQPRDLLPGDIVQLSFDGAAFAHSLIVVEAGQRILIATHTYDADYRPLDTYSFQALRGLHILR
jgi:hypothetical protein